MGNLRQIDGIQIFAEIHEGATTLVYKGYQPALERMVLVKVLRQELCENDDLCKRFEAEARLSARVQHPNVVAIYAFGRQAEAVYFAAEFVEGFSLAELLQLRRLPVDLAFFVLREVTKGLHAAHAKDVLHRDLKPANILISHDGQVKLSDFGMAALGSAAATEAGIAVQGTLGYIAPELIKGEASQKAADIFSLGATFYEMLAGAPAFPGSDPGECFQATLHSNPLETLQRIPGIPSGLIDICKKMLEKNPARRYPHCEALLDDLASLQEKQKIGGTAADLNDYLENPEAYRRKSMVATSTAAPPVEQAPKSYRGVYVTLSLLLLFVVVVLGMRLLKNREDSSSVLLPVASHDSTAMSTVPNVVTALDSADTTVLSTDSTPPRGQGADHTAEKAGPQRHEIPARPNHLADYKVPRREPLAPDRLDSAAAAMGLLRMTCVPWGVIFIDGDSIGTTPLQAALRLPAKQHRILIKNPDFPEYNATIQIESGVEKQLNFSFWTLVGNLRLEVSPWAEIFIDGVYRDTVPPQQKPFILVPGEHQLTLKHPTLGEWNTTFSIVAGQNLELQFNLPNLLSRKVEHELQN